MIARTTRRLLATTAALVVSASIATPAFADGVAPGPPLGIFVTEGQEDWQTDATFNVWWHNPTHDRPIAAAHYTLCPSASPDPCTVHEVVGQDISEMEVTVPSQGAFWVRVWLEDDQGDSDQGAKSQAVILRFDDEAPPAPLLDYDGGWLNATAPTNPSFPIQLPLGESGPVSKIDGYSLTVDGSAPDATVEALAAETSAPFTANHAFDDLPEGITDVLLRSVSNAGIASDLTTSAQIRLDRTSPTVAAHGLPDPAAWRREPVVVELSGADQPGLSGMAPAPLDRPADEGGHLSYSVDGAPAAAIRGGSGQVEIAADGQHTLAYRAFDAAGNPSPEATASFKIDRTPPEGAFEAPSPADPQRIAARVLDATSGIAGGRIEYRREGDAAFTALPTELSGGRLLARLDDAELPEGRYELRALATDVAGNQAAIGHAAGGAAMTLALPLRASARLDVAARVAQKRCKVTRRRAAKRRRKAARRPRRRCVTRTRTVAAGAPVVLAHGKRMQAVGHVSTAAGQPLAHARVTVEARSRSGGDAVAIGASTTDAQGNFRFAVPAGPSRALRFRFAGSGTVRPAMAQLVTEVRAAARLTVDRRRLRNGQAVRFTGRLLGRPVPSAGKVVALQAKVGRRWRTFATPRANAMGVFRHRYRFTSTTGLRRYAFRAVVTREDAYPYERGLSRIVRVTVRGR